MEASQLERYAPLSGIVAALLTVVGIILAGSSPDFLAGAQDIADYYGDDSGRIVAAAYVGILGTVALLWFVGVLRSRLRLTERGSGRLSATAFGGGVAATALFFLADGLNAAAALRADEDGRIDPGVAASLYDMAGISLNLAGNASAVLVLATGLLALRSGVLPRWLGSLSLVIGVGLLTPYAFAVLAVFLVWLVAVSVLLYLQPPVAPAAPVARVGA